MGPLLISIVFFVVFVIVLRLFGAWMLRIDEVIANQKELIKSIDRLNNNLGNRFGNDKSNND